MGILGSLAYRVYKNEEPAKTEIIDLVSKTKEWNSFMHIVHAFENNLGYWDKTPKRTDENKQFPSISKPQEYLHPHQNRCLNILETQRIMTYPDSFDFHDPNHECKMWAKIAIGQGVPVKFGQWIAEQCKLALDKNLDTDKSNADIIFQHHIQHRYSTYSIDEFLKLNEVLIKKEYTKLEK